MYFTRGPISSAQPTKNAHHHYQKERQEIKNKFMDFVDNYRKAKTAFSNKRQTPVSIDFSEYVRMLDERGRNSTAKNTSRDDIKPLRIRHSVQKIQRSKENKIVESCLPYFLVSIPNKDKVNTTDSVVNYSKMKRNDPLPLQRVRKMSAQKLL